MMLWDGKAVTAYIDSVNRPLRLFSLDSAMARNVDISFWHESIAFRNGLSFETALAGLLAHQLQEWACRTKDEGSSGMK